MKLATKVAAIILIVLAYCIYGFFSNPTISQSKIDYAIEYAESHNMNTDIIMFCDFSIPSGKKRFMVYSNKKKKVIVSSLCAQGKGKGFSNVPGSFCSSLGCYQIGYMHKMRIGCKSYILKGLSPTNSNAASRGILLHPYLSVSDVPIYPLGTSRTASKGCFVVSPLKFKMIESIIRKYSNKPILLYAYY